MIEQLPEAQHHWAPRAAHQQVVAASAVNEVVALAAIDDVTARNRIDHIVADAGVDNVAVTGVRVRIEDELEVEAACGTQIGVGGQVVEVEAGGPEAGAKRACS